MGLLVLTVCVCSEPPVSPEEAWDILCGLFEGMASVDLLMSAFEAAHCDLPSAIEELGRKLGDHESLLDVEEEVVAPHQGGGEEEAQDIREVGRRGGHVHGKAQHRSLGGHRNEAPVLQVHGMPAGKLP